MNATELWKAYCAKHPEFKHEGTMIKIKITALRAMIIHAHEKGVDHANGNKSGDAFWDTVRAVMTGK